MDMATLENGSASSYQRTNGTTSNELEILCRGLKAKVDNFLDTPTEDDVLNSVKNQVIVARGVIEEALRRYRIEELSLSYNGGKDCLVLLILILASLPSSISLRTSLSQSSTTAQAESSYPSPPFPHRLQALYIRPPLPFAEVDEFVTATSAVYHLDLTTSNQPMKPALTEYLFERPKIKAVFVGTRRTDPHGASLTFFDETDADWPRFMRIHPVIDWHYREVWGFIRALDIPYCPLYDMGYTSLGGIDDTHPNPALREAGKGSSSKADGQQFRPAYELTEDREERLGRDR
ncbi:adenine nucleotide alpha hydrolases-like protein [Daldinia caldariorum]|uniref:adenine nucleotide alpha hydrolases-like protein n=1 Tax=Daldinia caldariorum TaxID=326644 RepID=UPI0020075D38|nr:adenine nucleotide alpha hydrolases-like protein [Daldinia caldariorum]KAI1463085.1 adenine nucleotide alpha hydrolases-like protein [Daldinia caldariorum]